MNFEEDKLDIIDLYINGKLNAADLLEFEKRMKVDATLKEDVAIQKALSKSLADPHYQKFKAINKKVADEHFKPDPPGHPKPASNWIKYAVGIAAITLGAFVAFKYIPSLQEPSIEKPSKEKPSIENNVIADINENIGSEKIGPVMGRDDDILEFYNKGEFKEVIAKIKELDDPSGSQMWLGKAYFQDGQFEKAIQTFDGIISESRPTIKEKAKMYKAFAYLLNGKVDVGKSLLNKIELKYITSDKDKELIKKIRNSQ